MNEDRRNPSIGAGTGPAVSGFLLRSIALGAIAIYRTAISPVIHAMNGPACRFEPSCSEYARAAIAEYGIMRGGAMALWRIARCNPMGGHGYDPVPSRADKVLTGRQAASSRQEARNPSPPAHVWVSHLE
jgi:putative membrane protein insertion efficiency factor